MTEYNLISRYDKEIEEINECLARCIKGCTERHMRVIELEKEVGELRKCVHHLMSMTPDAALELRVRRLEEKMKDEGPTLAPL